MNDTFGYAVGDAVLKDLAGIAQDILRASDRLTRWGGEESLVLAPETRGEEAFPPHSSPSSLSSFSISSGK